MSTFRKEYRELTDHEKATVEAIKDKAEELLFIIQFGTPEENGNDERKSRESSLAQTKLEESVMWAVKHWTA